MELDERKLMILRAIVEDYIASAIPVGSRTISRKYLDWSSATIRNEMSDLEELGFLEQPHSSSGRIPSDRAYRLYVDRLMQAMALPASEVKRVRQSINAQMDSIEMTIRRAARALSEITSYTTMALTPQLRRSTIDNIHLVSIRPGTALLVVVTDAGIVRDSMIRVPEGLEESAFHRLSELLSNLLKGAAFDEIHERVEQALESNMAEHRGLIDSVFRVLDEGWEGHSGDDLVLEGAMNIFQHPEYNDIERARSFLSVLETRETLRDMLDRAMQMELSIVIGREHEQPKMHDIATVTATYRIGGESLGTIGVIGPMRMDYNRIVAVMGMMARSLSDILSHKNEE